MHVAFTAAGTMGKCKKINKFKKPNISLNIIFDVMCRKT